MKSTSSTTSSGFTLLEIVIVLAIAVLLTGVVLASFGAYRKSTALSKDTEAVMEILREARSKTVSSKNALSYGVRFTSTSTILFAGTAYAASTTNVTTPLSQNITLTTTLPAGVFDIVFNRITGETNQNSTISIKLTSDTLSSTTIQVYKTGTIEKQK